MYNACISYLFFSLFNCLSEKNVCCEFGAKKTRTTALFHYFCSAALEPRRLVQTIHYNVIMGRYTTVQAYADNNPNMRAVDYAQATGAASTSNSADNNSNDDNKNRGPVITEKVDNPYGSTAGAGSGEFHVYRHARAREMARWEQINASEAERKAEIEFQWKVAQDAKEEEEKTEKRRRKRERARDVKRRKKNMLLGGVDVGGGNEIIRGNNDNDHENDEEDEFEYTPIIASSQTATASTATAASTPVDGNLGTNSAIEVDNALDHEEKEEDRDTT